MIHALTIYELPDTDSTQYSYITHNPSPLIIWVCVEVSTKFVS